MESDICPEDFQVQSRIMYLVYGTSPAAGGTHPADDHDPEFRPYADMARDRLAELMDQAFRVGDFKKWLMMAEFFYNNMTSEELDIDRFATHLSTETIKEMEGLPHPNDVEPLARLAYRYAKAVVEAKARKLN